MASAKILEKKKSIVEEIKSNIENSESVIIFTYQGLKVSDLNELRRALKESDSSLKIYKNTLVEKAIEGKNLDLDDFLKGPNAIVFGKELLEPIKAISKFAKDHDKADIKVGIINGAKADLDVIKEYASIPSREGLLTMLAGGMIQYVKDLAVGLNMYAEQLEK